MKKFTLTILAAAALLFCTAPASQAGPGVHFGVVIGGGPVYSPYYPPYYYGPGPHYGYHGPHVYYHRGYYNHGYGYHHWR